MTVRVYFFSPSSVRMTGPRMHPLPAVFQAAPIRRGGQAADRQREVLHPSERRQVHCVPQPHKYASTLDNSTKNSLHLTTADSVMSSLKRFSFTHLVSLHFLLLSVHAEGEPRRAAVHHRAGQPAAGDRGGAQRQSQVTRHRGRGQLGPLIHVFFNDFG